MANHPVKLDMVPRALVGKPKPKPGVRLYLIRHKEKVFYFMAKIVGMPNMRIAVAEAEAAQWVGADPSLPLEERAKAFGQMKVEMWVQDELRRTQNAIDSPNPPTKRIP